MDQHKLSTSDMIHTIVEGLFFVRGCYWQKALKQYLPEGPNVVSQQHVVI